MRATREIRDERKIAIIITEQYARPVIPIIDYAFHPGKRFGRHVGHSQELMDNPDVRSLISEFEMN